ncbi:MAG TPA: R3H domain-containing nucleic acid-binding protein [Lapillicoccus sp.]|nr:R3H domain-containing nucleic acid-binding protein [Lapillicoccus sp.]
MESQADADLEAEGDADDESEGVGPNGARRAGGSRVRLLEREGEVAADFLERLLDIADLDGDIEVDIDGDRASVAIVDSEDGRVPRRMVGSDGKVLDALQELTRLAVQAETGERSRLMLDIAGHRAQRRAVVVEIAQTAIAEVKTTGTQKALEDMSAFERKIVHDEVAAAGLGSESEGVEPHRHIIVFPA